MKRKDRQNILDRIKKEIDIQNINYNSLKDNDYVSRGICLGRINGLLTAKIIIQESTMGK